MKPLVTSRKLFLLAGLFLLGVVYPGATAWAQESSNPTEQRLEDLRNQIESLEQQRSRTAEREEATLETLEETNREIRVRQALIDTYSRRIGELEARRDSLRRSMKQLERQQQRLKQEYQERVTHAYKYGRLHDLALILSAESINQVFIRIKYLRQFAQQREERREKIVATNDKLQQQQENLQETLAENRKLLENSRAERRNLVQLKQERQELVTTLRERQTSLESELAEKRAAAERLEQELENLMATEERRTREAGEVAKEEARVLTGSFQDNKGGLPWPVSGVVTEDYGTRVHEVHGTKTVSPGITIQTNPSETVEAVFRGTVARVTIMPGYGSCAIIRHGEYMSVYCNLSSLYVREGDQVRAGDRIAHAGTTDEPLGAGLFFGLFTGNGHINPQPWLQSR
jgi:septal ring factor EnvC (AmiA/AmiB activator)